MLVTGGPSVRRLCGFLCVALLFFSVTGIAEMTINMIQLRQVDADENGHRPADLFSFATFVRHPCGASELER